MVAATLAGVVWSGALIVLHQAHDVPAQVRTTECAAATDVLIIDEMFDLGHTDDRTARAMTYSHMHLRTLVQHSGDGEMADAVHDYFAALFDHNGPEYVGLMHTCESVMPANVVEMNAWLAHYTDLHA